MSKFTIMLLAILVSFGLVGCRKTQKPSSMVLHYAFDELTGEVTQERVSKQDNHIYYVFNERNRPLLFQEPRDPEWRENGIKGGALRFDGYSNYLIQEDVVMPKDAFTLSAWVAPHAFEWGDGGHLSAILSQSDFANHQGIDFGMFRHGSWGVKLALGTELTKASHTLLVEEDYALVPNTWQFIAVTFDKQHVKFFYNGALVKTVTLGDYQGLPIRVAEQRDLLIGKNSAGLKIEAFDVNMYNGLLDELKVQSVALSEQAISSMYQSYLEPHGGKIPTLTPEETELSQLWYASDRNRPQFHAMPNGHWMNEPHAPFYYNGYYHLFYQHNPTGPFWHQIHWGHWVSTDMIHWTDVGVAIRPHHPVTPDGVWSGAAILDKDGLPVLFITAGNDALTPNQGVALCRPVDLNDPLLKEWKCDDELAISQVPGQGKPGEFRDPFVFVVDGIYYTLVGSGTSNNQGGTSLIYSSTDLVNFTFRGELFVSNYQAYPFLGLQWELPVFLPLKDEQGNPTNKWFYAISPHPVSLADVEVYYWIGEFDTQTARFIPDHPEPRVLDYGDGAFTGPSGFVDPQTGRSILFTIAQGIGANAWQQYYSGWAHTAGMPVELWYNTETNRLNFQPIEELENARKEVLFQATHLTFDEANAQLTGVGGDLVSIVLEVSPNGSDFGINVRQSTTEVTTIRYSDANKHLVYNSVRSSENVIGFQRVAPVTLLPNGNVRLHIVLDRSLVEIYVNNMASITSRIYPVSSESKGISVFTEGNPMIVSFDVYRMGSVYHDEVIEGYYLY